MFKLAIGLAGGALLVIAGGAGLTQGARSGPPPEPARIEMRRGHYAQEQWTCRAAPNLFRFDGPRMGWVFADGGDNFSLPAEVEREPGGRYRIYIQDIDVDPAVHPDARMEFHLRPLADGRVAIRVHGDRIYRLCPDAELPAWARRR